MTRCEFSVLFQDGKFESVQCQVDMTNEEGWVKAQNWNPKLTDEEHKMFTVMSERLAKEAYERKLGA